MKYYRILLVFGLAIFSLNACKKDEGTDKPDDFNRTEMLENWADNMIIPALEDYVFKLSLLNTEASNFVIDPSETNLNILRSTWENAYISWQNVSMFDIGKAEETSLRNFTNIYPANTTEIEANVLNTNYNLELPSTFDEKGFPALDYLLFGIAESDTEILALYADIYSAPNKYGLYLQALTARLETLADTVLSDWKNNYRDTFVANSGSEANASVNKLVNDYLYYYEKFFRAGKIGIPAGVFSGNVLENTVEGFYKKNLSKTLYIEALQAAQDLFNGKSFNNTQNGTSLKNYLDYLQEGSNEERLSDLINAGFDNVKNAAEILNDNFVIQLQEDEFKMLTCYDRMQELLVLFKVDMLQQLNIKVDYIDADGD